MSNTTQARHKLFKRSLIVWIIAHDKCTCGCWLRTVRIKSRLIQTTQMESFKSYLKKSLRLLKLLPESGRKGLEQAPPAINSRLSVGLPAGPSHSQRHSDLTNALHYIGPGRSAYSSYVDLYQKFPSGPLLVATSHSISALHCWSAKVCVESTRLY